ncbi:tRNA (adenosine(37)-N6)-threonylcarbamoyltransferase complex dimerization subunit type 1 TsaB [Alphaproteobacteria bacterium]|nr:tRNA (adenosine(37)-N6)-threonylcarbamoyltransferase complex dimerization subunit type 1 TsaB [Alphaproteobacteria bacterium]
MMTATRRTPSRSDIATVILGLEASGGLLSVALWADGCIQAEQSHAARHGHAALIAPMVDAVMKAANCGFSDLSHIAAGRGPGSFTGIRVALAMAKGLCLATGVVGVGVNGLAALAAHYFTTSNLGEDAVLVSAETRRGPCYAQIFDRMGNALTEIFESDIAKIAQHVPTGLDALSVIGWQADAIANVLRDGSHISVGRDAEPRIVDAGQIATLAAAQIASGQAEQSLSPLYLAPAFLGPSKNKPATGQKA